MKLKPLRWRATKIADDQFLVENGERSETLRSQHCKCCALVTAIIKHGGVADLRGLHIYGPCYQMLVVTARGSTNED